ncbi:MAG: response regulator [Dissulfurispiraceae bacterium]|jgi:CheY-like chemotaxis protein/anti-sigma regulatory factor (Ser/Thr protein kinase)
MEQHGLTELKNIASECTVLCVEDNEDIREFINAALSGLFKKVDIACDGREGLEKFGHGRADLVITDHLMPRMTGLDMVREIRAISPQAPVILLTGHADIAVLAEAINIGITQFIAKPFTVYTLLNAVEAAVRGVIFENLKTMKEKLDLLKYKEEYHALQQRMALRKQQNFIRDDLYYKKLDVVDRDGGICTYLVNIRYQPFDVLSGDFYTVRKVGSDRILLHLTDATGKGLSAFVTTSIAAAFGNHAIEKGIAGGGFSFKAFVDDYAAFVKKQLLQDEAICSLFVLLDFRNEVMDIANFSMPPVFLLERDGSVGAISPNNLPLMNFDQNIVMDRHDMSGFRKLLLCSDGLYSPEYKPYMETDFRDAPFKNILYESFSERTGGPDDDLTMIFLRKFDTAPLWSRDFSIMARLSEVAVMGSEVEGFLSEKGFEPIFVTEFITALTELLMNAYEHGSLNIGWKSKQKLVRKGLYEEYLSGLESTIDKRIQVKISSFDENGIFFLGAAVTDEGNGFDTSLIKESVRDIELLHYRGIKIVKGLVDEIYFNEKGNEVTIFKRTPLYIS